MAKKGSSNLRFLARLTLLALLGTAAFGVHAKGIFGFGDDEDDGAKKLTPEWAVVLPALPKSENLLPFTPSPAATLEFAVDSKSLSAGAGEVRYTVVSTSKAGARNASYEGIRCASLEMKRYALEHDGKWFASRSDKWMPIQHHSANRPQSALAREYFCLGGSVAGRTDEMLDRIRYNRPLEENNYKPF